MNPFDRETWRAIEEFDRFRRREQMMSVDLNAVMRQQDSFRSHSAAYEALNDLSRNPSHKWAMEGAVTSRLTEAARVANLSAVEMFSQRRIEAVLANYDQLSAGWNDRVRLFEASSTNALKTAVETHLSDIAEMSVLAESAFARFTWENVGRSLRVPDALISELQTQVLDFTQSYGSLMSSLSQSSRILAMPPRVSELAAQEFFLGSRFVKSISAERREDEVEEESEELEHDIALVLEDELEVLLAQLDPGLVKMITGARQAFNSTNADRVRHVITSYRELNMHVLHELAPDDSVRAWSTSPDDFANGKPTRKARLKFICRNINHGAFDGFVDKDIETMVKIFDFLNKGTHAVTSNFTEPQLRALKVKAESAVQLMLTIWQQ